MLTYEWRTKLQRNKDAPPILSIEPVSGTNFRSVYGYPKETEAFIEANANVAGLRGKTVGAAWLFIDVDEDENVEAVEKVVAGLGVAYSKWTTGNRGAHFHIDMEYVCDPRLPYSQAEFIRGLGLDKLVDMSIYRAHSIFRVPGAVHQDTGLTKKMEYEVQGKVLSILLGEEPEPAYVNLEEGDEESIRRFKANLLQRRGVGKRHPHLYILFQSGIMAGHDIDSMLDYMLWWNDQQATPHSEEAIHRKWKGFINGRKSKIRTKESSGVLPF